MPSPCAWCGLRAVCPRCTAAALEAEGGVAAPEAPSHYLQGSTDEQKAPESTAIAFLPPTGTIIVAPPPHEGSEACYSGKGCREDACRQAHTEYRAAQRRARGAQVRTPGGTHGRVNMYRRGCRCFLCREAAVAYQRDHRASKKPSDQL